MTKDDILRMAREAGLYHFYDSEGHCSGITDARLVNEDQERCDDRLVEMLAPFANLVAAQEREACKQWFIEDSERFAAQVALAEREACAKVCDTRCIADGWEGCYADECAAAIRARGNT